MTVSESTGQKKGCCHLIDFSSEKFKPKIFALTEQGREEKVAKTETEYFGCRIRLRNLAECINCSCAQKKIFAMEYQDKGPSLCKFSRYLVVIKIMDIRHKICHIYYKNADFESIFSQKDSLYCCYMCAKFSSTCKIVFIFSCIFSSVLWDNFLWMTLYL